MNINEFCGIFHNTKFVKMSAVGIDFGNENCYIAVARSGGIETIANDYSQRATPSYVAFGPTCRNLGTSAKNQFITNLQNTITSFKRLIGKNFKDPTCQYELSYLPYVVHELPNGSVGVKVLYLGNEVLFTVPQIAAMLMTKLKNITEVAILSKMTNCVISVPIFFTDSDRRAMLDVCRIAGINVLRLLNEPAAVALAYGFYRQDLSDDKSKKVAFVDIGHSSVQTSVCEFFKGRLKILASTWDYCLGGRDIDNCMVRHFSQEFKTKYNIDVFKNNRAIIRLLQECEKLKKQLSANPQVLPLNIECFMEDKDVSSSLGRDKLEEICSEVLKRIENVLRRLINEANLHPGDLCAVELAGGTTRIPAVKNIIKKVFGIEPSTTLNLDEATARGCAIQAAMLSPGVKVRDFYITDIQPFTIKLVWNISKNECGDIEVYPQSHPVPYSKLLTFFRKEDFTLSAVYLVSKEKSIPDIPIGSFIIKNVQQLPSGESVKIIVKLRINIHGIFNVCSAMIVDKDFKENMALDQRAEDLLDVHMKNSGFSIPLDSQINEQEKKNFFSLKKHKKTSPGIELQIEAKVPQLSESELKTFIESEQKMIIQDESEEKRINAKNSFEEYVYEIKGYLSKELKSYTDEQERIDFLHKLNSLEDWLYDEGENQTEAVYKERHRELELLAEPLFWRKSEAEQRGPVLQEFQSLINGLHHTLEEYLKGEKQYAHIDPKNMEKVQHLVDAKNKWLQQQNDLLKKIKLSENPPILAEQILQQYQQLQEEVSPLLNVPKTPDVTPKQQTEVTEDIKC